MENGEILYMQNTQSLSVFTEIILFLLTFLFFSFPKLFEGNVNYIIII